MGLEEYLNDVKGASIVGAVVGIALTTAVAAYPEGRELFMQKPLVAGEIFLGATVVVPALHTLAEVTKYVMERAYDLGVESARRIKDFYNFLTKDTFQSHHY